MKMTPTKNNPRYANGNLRRKHRARLRAMGCECGICHGRFGPIHYDEPSDAAHPLSFVVDEIKPVAKWKQFGYPSARAAAEDWDNLQAAHYFGGNFIIFAGNNVRIEGFGPKIDGKYFVDKTTRTIDRNGLSWPGCASW